MENQRAELEAQDESSHQRECQLNAREAELAERTRPRTADEKRLAKALRNKRHRKRGKGGSLSRLIPPRILFLKAPSPKNKKEKVICISDRYTDIRLCACIYIYIYPFIYIYIDIALRP